MTQERCKHKFSCLDCGAMLPKDPDLLAVARAAKEWREARKLQGDIGTSWTRLADAEQALRSALALLEERGL